MESRSGLLSETLLVRTYSWDPTPDVPESFIWDKRDQLAQMAFPTIATLNPPSLLIKGKVFSMPFQTTGASPGRFQVKDK